MSLSTFVDYVITDEVNKIDFLRPLKSIQADIFLLLSLKGLIENSFIFALIMLINLNLPKYDFKLKRIEGYEYIFDEVRKKYIKLTPEN